MAKTAARIVEDQVRIWSHRQRVTSRAGRVEKHWPVITLSREVCAQGDALAQALAQRTGFTLWDRALLHAVAEESEADERLMALLDEHRRNAIDDAVQSLLTGRSNVHYLKALMRVVFTIAAHGRSIIVGRGAHYICNPNDCLRVRVVAPLPQRVQRYAVQHGIDEREARRQLEALDADQADFIQHHFRHDLAAPADYDLVVNTGSYTPDQTAELVLDAYEAKLGHRPAARLPAAPVAAP